MKPVQIVLTALLLASALVGIEILSSDEWLWYVAPTHAYGLIAFVVLDSALAIALWRTTRLAVVGSALFGAVQFVAMFGDILMGQPAGAPGGLWRSYLLSDIAFTLLLGIQLVIVASAVLAVWIGVADPKRHISSQAPTVHATEMEHNRPSRSNPASNHHQSDRSQIWEIL